MLMWLCVVSHPSSVVSVDADEVTEAKVTRVISVLPFQRVKRSTIGCLVSAMVIDGDIILMGIVNSY